MDSDLPYVKLCVSAKLGAQQGNYFFLLTTHHCGGLWNLNLPAILEANQLSVAISFATSACHM